VKQIKSIPSDTVFFATYALLAATIRRSGWIAQVISGLTEIGGIYAAAYAALLPIFPYLATTAAGIIAVLGTALIEVGLRVLAPYSVDAVLNKRYDGLHLAMTIATMTLTVFLIATSGWLSFNNSFIIVEEFTPAAEPRESTPFDSTLLRRKDRLYAEWKADSTALTKQFATQIVAQKQAYDGQYKALRRTLSNWYNREIRTGNSYATAKDRVRQELADLEADHLAQVAALRTQEANAIQTAKERLLMALSHSQTAYEASVDSLKQLNNEATVHRTKTVRSYGSGLAWFTIIALLVFLASVILDRIHRKGSGIRETVELSQYDIAPNMIAEGWHAVRERLHFTVRNRIKDFADQTPPAPLPTRPTELYDPTQLANITINLKVEQAADPDERVIYLTPKRRPIGFQTSSPDPTGGVPKQPPNVNGVHPRTAPDVENQREAVDSPASNTNEKAPAPDDSCAVNRTPSDHADLSLADLLQRLKMYKKRVGKHEAKKRAAEKAGKPVPKRTLNALSNNKDWVSYYQKLIDNIKH
jgi:hypothetical protein